MIGSADTVHSTGSRRDAAQATGLYDVFRSGALRHPRREFCIHRTTRLSWRETLDLVDRCAAALADAGVGSGDRVAMLSPTRPETDIVFLACAKMGAIFVGLGTRSRRHDLEFVCGDAQPAVLLVMDDPLLDDHILDLIDIADDLGLRRPVLLSCTEDGSIAPEFDDFVANSVVAHVEAEVDESAAVTIVYTSGTTGPPKGVVLSHRSLMNYRHLLARTPMTSPRLLSCMPVDHIGHIGNELTAVVLTGGTLVQLPRFDAREALAVIEAEGVTAWTGAVPTMLNRVVDLDEFGSADLGCLELVWWTGKVSERTAQSIARRVDRVAASYGMSEMCCITMTDVDVDADLTAVMSTVGTPLKDIDMRIAPDGEILLRRVGMMSGYWRNPEATARAVDGESWFHTGDLGQIDDDGNLRITGRCKLQIRSGGYNLSPFEIESVLESHPGVSAAIVVGVPDDEYGEAAHAAWTPSHGIAPTDGQLRAYLRERLSGFKVPKGFYRFDRLQLLPNGKLDRLDARRRVLAEIVAGDDMKEITDVG